MDAESKALSATRLAEARRVVIKIGSSLFVDQGSGALHRSWLTALCEDVAAMHASGQETSR